MLRQVVGNLEPTHLIFDEDVSCDRYSGVTVKCTQWYRNGPIQGLSMHKNMTATGGTELAHAMFGGSGFLEHAMDQFKLISAHRCVS